MNNSNMNESFVEKKVPGGKLVQLKLTFDQNKIDDVSITGDFFVYPESEISTIEDSIKGKPVDSSVEEFKEYIESDLGSETELLGFDTKVVAELIMEAVSND